MLIKAHVHCAFCGAAITTDQQIHYLKHGHHVRIICEDCIFGINSESAQLIEDIVNRGQTE